MACGEDRYIAEDLEATFSPQVECIEVWVEGETPSGCDGTEIVIANRCTEELVFIGWSFTCDGDPACEGAISPGDDGRAPLDIDGIEGETTFTFDGRLGLEAIQIVVSVDVDHETPGCSVGSGSGDPGWLGLVVLSLAAARRLRAAAPRRGTPCTS